MRKSDLVTKAYQARSQRVAHSPQPSVQIDPNLLHNQFYYILYPASK
jgi:hypothetical protein